MPSPQPEFALGQLVRLSCTFSGGRTPTDPTTITTAYRDPSGAVTSLTYGVDAALKRQSTGVYYVDVSASIGGTWSHRFAGTGACESADEKTFYVKRSVVL